MVRGTPAPGLKALFRRAAVVVAVGLVAAQLIRPDRTNPPTDPTRTLAATVHPPASVLATLDRGCRDCHTNDTVWPWYTNVAPLSWFIVGHVNEGRQELNLSNWGAYDKARRAKRLAQICDLV